MTFDRRLILRLLAILMIFDLTTESRYHHQQQHDDDSPKHRHRHRHKTTLTNRRNHHDFNDRRSPWTQDVDYDEESNIEMGRVDGGDEEEDYDEDYDVRPHYDRTYPQNRKIHHSRAPESRYPFMYHDGGYRFKDWYSDDNDNNHNKNNNNNERMSSFTYGSKNSRHRYNKSYHKMKHLRPRVDDSDYENDPSDEEETDWSRGHEDEVNNSPHRHRSSWWRNFKRHRFQDKHKQSSFRHNVKHNYHHRYADIGVDGTNDSKQGSKYDSWRRRFNSNVTDYKRGDQRIENGDDAHDYLDNVENRDKEDEEDDIWKEADSESENDDDDNDDNDDEEEVTVDDHNDDEFDDYFHKSEEKPPLRTYDDIIKRLTSDVETTQRPTIKRDYRNIEKYLRRDAYGNLRYEPRNVPKSSGNTKILNPSTTTKSDSDNKTKDMNKRVMSPVMSKPSKSGVDKSISEKKDNISNNERGTGIKSLPTDYEDYMDSNDDEKKEDSLKTGTDMNLDTYMQADINNAEYPDEEVTEEDEEFTDTFTMPIPTTTTTTTSTPRPIVTQHYDYKDPRAYESGTGVQYNGYQSKHEYPPMSAHSIHKWQSLGTREGVKETRNNIQQFNKSGKIANIREALQHAIKVSREGSCQWPRARVIPVRDVYPSPSTTYIPHCAILHRCSDDTGCCRSEALTCVPKQSHRVELYFYTTNVGGASVVEKLSFYNHTECECKERIGYESPSDKTTEARTLRNPPSSLPPQNMRRLPPKKPCRCPSEFTPRITSDGECQCNCFDNDQACIRTKRGKGYFSLRDRLCIQNDECSTPNCEFGEYMRRQGKCPRKKDKFDAIANYHTSANHRYKS